MSHMKTIAIGVVMLVAGILLRVLGGETEIGPFDLRTVGNVIAVIGAVDLVIALGGLVFAGWKELE